MPAPLDGTGPPRACYRPLLTELTEQCGKVTNGTLKGSSSTLARELDSVKNCWKAAKLLYWVRRLCEAYRLPGNGSVG